jgi:hypothetical protein
MAAIAPTAIEASAVTKRESSFGSYLFIAVFLLGFVGPAHGHELVFAVRAKLDLVDFLIELTMHMTEDDLLNLALGKNDLHHYPWLLAAPSGHPFVQWLPLYPFPVKVSTESFNQGGKSDNQGSNRAFRGAEKARRRITNLAPGDLQMGGKTTHGQAV